MADAAIHGASAETRALKRDFERAVERVGSRPLPGLDEAAQRRLFGLFHRATAGPAPDAAKTSME